MVSMHPNAAAAESIEHGDRVYIETQHGRVRQTACISDSLNPRVICADFGLWFPEPGKRDLHGWQESNINLLFGDESLDGPETGSLNLRGLLCRVYKAGKK